MNNSRFTPSNAQHKDVAGIQFSIMSSEEIVNQSVVLVNHSDLFEKGIPKPNGLYDLRMGTTDKKFNCQTCMSDLINCQGHFGHLVMATPIYNICYMKQMYKILQCVCMRCSELLLPSTTDNIHQTGNINKSRAMLRFKRVYEAIKKVGVCPTCEFQQPKWVLDNTSLQCIFSDKTHSVTTKTVLNILRKISDTDCVRLGHDPVLSHPKNMIIEVLPIPPPVIRPSIMMDPTARTQDDLTHKLIEIIKSNQQVEKNMKTKVQPYVFDEHVNLLQFHVNTYIDNEIPGQPQATQRTGRPIKSIAQRLKSKEGRVRGNLMGKRVDYSARTVITAEPNIRLDELGVPESIARNLTFSEIVTDYNKAFLQGCVNVGPDPVRVNQVGARYVTQERTKNQKDLRFVRDVVLENGDVVERHLMDGDYVVFNRQPTLHKMSMMGHRVRVMKGNTFRLNLSATTPYNADFDGDEMNMHVPCSHASRTEVKELMMVSKCIVSPQSNKPVMGIVQDALLACRLLSMRDEFITKVDMMNMMCVLGIHDRLPMPAILKPLPLWTGKQLFSMILPKKKYMTLRRFSTHREDDEQPDFSCTDTEVLIVNGELLSGILCKKTLGPSSGGIIHQAWIEGSPEEACAVISNIQFLANNWLVNRGFSVSVSDCVNTSATQKRVDSLVEECIQDAHTIINDGIERRSLPDTYEPYINNTLNRARDSSGRYVQKQLDSSNNMYAMVSGGSKGSVINIAQIMACVGQQNVNGNRIGFGYTHRSLPHFQRYDNTPASRGFVRHSYIQGLTPTEFFFHAMGGREGVIDTAIKTSETGYIQRRLVKAMEDIRVEFDGTVRNSIGDIVQFKYGEDGMDGSMLIGQSVPQQKEMVYFPINLHDFCRNYPHTKRVDANQPEPDNPMFTPLFNGMLRAFSISNTDEYIAHRYQTACIAPGEMVGIVAAQSLGQPITQMTLNTFHAAGISAVNVTLGVPRLKEIINVSKNIKSPSMKIYPRVKGLEHDLLRASLGCFVTSEQIMYRLEPFAFETDYVELMNIDALRESFTDTNWSIVYTIDINVLGQHALTMLDLTYWLNNTYDTIWCSGDDENADKPRIVIRLFTNHGGLDDLDKIKQLSKRLLSDMSLKKFKNIQKCVLDPHANCIDTIGIDMGEVLMDDRVDASRTTCNDVLEIFSTLGIEAARETLLREIKQVIEFDGSYVDYRHISMLVDTMTYKGNIMAITRHGINRTETGVLMRCSFEETVNIITDAAMHAEYDPIKGVTENIIMGKTAKVGTGLVDVLFDIDRLNALLDQQSTLLAGEEPDDAMPRFRPSTPTRENISYESSYFPLKE